MFNKAKGAVKDMVMKLLNIQEAMEHPVNIVESLTHREDVLKNELWYRGDPSELDQFFKQTTKDMVSQSRFWAAVPSKDNSIRKLHSGLPSEIADKLADIVIADLNSIEIDDEVHQQDWDEINKDNKFTQELLGDAITKCLISGDGVFKLTIDTEVSHYPLIEFYSAAEVEYVYKRGRIQEYKFSSYYTEDKKSYRLEETYSKGAITYKLYNDKNKEVSLSKVPKLQHLTDIAFNGDYIMAVPIKFFKSPKYEGRGDSIFSRKTDNFDSLDEIISQWIDAFRQGRVKNYIPESLLPKGDNGETLRPNSFDHQYIKTGTSMKEDAKEEITQRQADINYNAFVESYASMVDMCLQGIISPATLGIDLKKTDNAEAQREKEKTTLYTRGKIIDVLVEALPKLISTSLRVYYTSQMLNLDELEETITVNFGEYASPDFDSTVDVVGKAKSFGIMSLEQSIEELYGDNWTDEEKAEEVERIRMGDGALDIPAAEVDGLEHMNKYNLDDSVIEDE